MSKMIGGIATSHVPGIGAAIAKGLQKDPYWAPFFDGFPPAHAWLAERRPDAIVMFYNDHGLNFFLDNQPTFAVGAAPVYENADEGWGLPVTDPFPGDPALSWRIIEHLVANEFDIATCQAMKVDHAFAIPTQLLWPDGTRIPTVPIAINTVQHPIPSVSRCFKLGRAVGDAVRAAPDERRVLVIASGGLSHQLEGDRAGFINKAFDLEFLAALEKDPQSLCRYSTREIVDLAGSQGVELLSWVAMRAALGERASQAHLNYHIPISNTASCLLVLDPA